jgi:hypothetical protein
MTIVVIPMSSLPTIQSVVFDNIDSFDVIQDQDSTFMLCMFERALNATELSKFGVKSNVKSAKVEK